MGEYDLRESTFEISKGNRLLKFYGMAEELYPEPDQKPNPIYLVGKDPAILFYTADWIVGTSTMNWEDRGKYIHLLATMHQKGRLEEETIRFLVGNISPDLRSKFQIDEEGLWYNSRLEEEIQKRGRFVDSRRENGKKGGRPKGSGKKKPEPKKNLVVNLPVDENEDEKIKLDKETSFLVDKLFQAYPHFSEKLRESWEVFLDMRKKQHKFKYKSYQTMEKAFRDLFKVAGSDQEKAIEVLDKSSYRHWKGFHAPRSTGSTRDNLSQSNAARELVREKLKDDENSH